MAFSRPPALLPGTPAKVTLPSGTPLFRLHSATRPATAFNPRPAHCLYGGGRFDATGCDRYGYLYAGLTTASAVCESLLRSMPFDASGSPRAVPRAAVIGRRLSVLELAADLTVVGLVSGRDLAAVAQDSWLVQAEAEHYPYTRDWGHWIRGHTADWGQGFVWPSKREPADRVVVLFDDRCPAGAVVESSVESVDFDTRDGEAWLNAVLEPYRAQVPPRAGSVS